MSIVIFATKKMFADRSKTENNLHYATFYSKTDHCRDFFPLFLPLIPFLYGTEEES